MTHPFHPLFNQEFDGFGCRRAWGEQRVYYDDEEGQVRSLPVVWTNMSAEAEERTKSGGGSLFRAEELLELVQLVERLGESV